MDEAIKAMREAAARALCSLSRHDGGLCPVRCSACIRDADAALIAGLRALPSNIVLAQSTGPAWLGARPAIFFSEHQLEWLASAIEAATVAPEPTV